ncbi:MAG: transcription repressor NadR [Clostridia bacterium]|nr:transcription repressor NadR [Clostridia bacterium]
MNAEERRKEIALFLLSQNKPVPGAMLAEQFKVSRQIIVQDVSSLKDSGYEVLSTHYGYLLKQSPYVEKVFKFKHEKEQTEDELTTVVDLGGIVVDVFVWHKVYGKVRAELNIYSKYHVKKFMDGVRSGKSTELMDITGGYHYHTVRAESKEILDLIEKELNKKGFIMPED